MSVNITVPALRQPKTLKKESFKTRGEIQNVIITLQNNIRLVVTSDAYHGIICGREIFHCVFCRAKMELHDNNKESHKSSVQHRNVLEKYPHIGEHGENLCRKLDENNYYCTLCNVVVSLPFFKRHLSTDVHIEELKKANTRASIYKPLN